MYILVRQVFKGDNYSREETINYLDFFSETTIQGRKLFAEIRYVVMGALVCKLSDLETPQLKIYLPICKERSSGLSATAVWWRRYWRQPGGGNAAAVLHTMCYIGLKK